MINVLQKLSTTKLTRKEFIVYMGGIFVGIIGIPSLLKLVSEVKPRTNAKSQKLARIASAPKPHTFGSGAYGV